MGGAIVEFFDALVRYEITLWELVDRQLVQAGCVNLGQLHALRVVARYGDQARVQDLSDDIGITVGAVSKLVDRLERDGLVARRPNPANRRSSLIGLTDGGEAGMTIALEMARAAVARAVGTEDVQPLVAALARLQGRLDDLTDEAA